MYGGRTLVDPRYVREAIDTWTGFILKLDVDTKGHSIIILTYDPGPLQVLQYLAYSELVAHLPTFDGPCKVPTLQSSLGMLDYTNLAADMADLQ